MRFIKYMIIGLVVLLLGYHIVTIQLYTQTLDKQLSNQIAYIQKNYLSHTMEIKLKDSDLIEGDMIHFVPNYFSVGGTLTSSSQKVTLPKSKDAKLYGTIQGKNIKAYFQADASILSNPKQPIHLKATAQDLALDTPNGPISADGSAIELQLLDGFNIEKTSLRSLKLSNFDMDDKVKAGFLSIQLTPNEQTFSTHLSLKQISYRPPEESPSPLMLIEDLAHTLLPTPPLSLVTYAENYPFPSNIELDFIIDQQMIKLHHHPESLLSQPAEAQLKFKSQNSAFNNSFQAVLRTAPKGTALLQTIELDSQTDINNLKLYENYHNATHQTIHTTHSPVELPSLKRKTLQLKAQAVSPKFGQNLHDIEAELSITHTDLDLQTKSTKCTGKIKSNKVLLLPRFIEINGVIQNPTQKTIPSNLKEVFRMETEIPATESHFVQYIERTNQAKEPIKTIISYVPADGFSLIQSVIS